jgi:hypothetical protein
MSRPNKVNPGQYTQAGRLSPDDAARARRKQNVGSGSERSGSGQKAVRPAPSKNKISEEQESDQPKRRSAPDR